MSPRWADTPPYVGATPLGPLDLPHPSVGWLPRSTPHCLSLSPTGRCPGRDTNILPVRDRSLPGPQTCWRLLPAAPGRRRALPLIYCSQGHRPTPLTIAVSVARFDALPLQCRLRACRDEVGLTPMEPCSALQRWLAIRTLHCPHSFTTLAAQRSPRLWLRCQLCTPVIIPGHAASKHGSLARDSKQR